MSAHNVNIKHNSVDSVITTICFVSLKVAISITIETGIIKTNMDL